MSAAKLRKMYSLAKARISGCPEIALKDLVAASPELNGASLPAPEIRSTGWREGTVFTAQDDPDRINEPWEHPSFVTRKDPVRQREKTSCLELQLPNQAARLGQAAPSSSFARVITGVLDPEDCVELIERVNAKGFTPALINIGGGNQRLIKEARDGHRVIVDSRPLSAWLLEVLRPYLPEHIDGGELVDLNERCRFLCYTPGQSFPAHFDGAFERADTGDRSQITVQVYLHDVLPNAGGATTFLFHGGKELPCQPQGGSVLIFTQDLYHEGSLLLRGLKYTLRTEAMYGGRALRR